MKCTHCVGLAAAALVMFPAGSAPLVQVSESNDVTGGIMEPNRPYRIGLSLILKVSRTSNTDFDALVGPLPNAPVGTSTVISATQVPTASGNRIEYVLNGADGFIYMSGIQPYGGTEGGSAAGEGTTMIVQRVTDTTTGITYHRYFRLTATKPVDVVAPPDTVSITQDYNYVEKTEAGGLGPVTRIPTVTDPDPLGIRKFVLDVLVLANGRVPTPPPPP